MQWLVGFKYQKIILKKHREGVTDPIAIFIACAVECAGLAPYKFNFFRNIPSGLLLQLIHGRLNKKILIETINENHAEFKKNDSTAIMFSDFFSYHPVLAAKLDIDVRNKLTLWQPWLESFKDHLFKNINESTDGFLPKELIDDLIINLKSSSLGNKRINAYTAFCIFKDMIPENYHRRVIAAMISAPKYIKEAEIWCNTLLAWNDVISKNERIMIANSLCGYTIGAIKFSGRRAFASYHPLKTLMQFKESISSDRYMQFFKQLISLLPEHQKYVWDTLVKLYQAKMWLPEQISKIMESLNIPARSNINLSDDGQQLIPMLTQSDLDFAVVKPSFIIALQKLDREIKRAESEKIAEMITQHIPVALTGLTMKYLAR